MKLQQGMAVQLAEDVPTFANCLLYVVEPKEWGVVGCVQLPGQREVYYRAAWSEIAVIFVPCAISGPGDVAA